ncbi:MAG: 2-succinyl-5-enolpyruvyl-6-hydroxy-3-cyclohexene-1-carboxylic-acid synthase [Prevotella sp.]|nr:2-succinyl-5-enolpyruvyl-6-hydroxy-3-cyclohexene-1-carboxylic-acid synthase [Prevotella sp.]
MYSDKDAVNILTALLVRHDVCDAVVCPGSRNAPIVHNLVVCPEIVCHGVTDERSAGFYALGIALATGRPVAICVTSGTALLNVLPAVAEAFYKRIPLVVISADRPGQWIDQLDGQTLQQGDGLGRFVRKAVTLPEVRDAESRWYCNRLVNEALLGVWQHGGGPVHINVPLSEPLYGFTVAALPAERVVSMVPSRSDRCMLHRCAEDFLAAHKPMMVVGDLPQLGSTPCHPASQSPLSEVLGEIPEWKEACVVLNESLSMDCGGCRFDEVLSGGTLPSDYEPDFVLVLGGTLVSRRIKTFLRRLPADVRVWAVSEDGELRDTFQNLCGVIEGRPSDVLADLWQLSSAKEQECSSAFVGRWARLLSEADECVRAFCPDYSQMAAVKRFEDMLGEGVGVAVHYGNSSAIRLANIYARHYVYCNRGVNGIEGSLSTAAGFSLVAGKTVYCVLGDLSFFYDGNALWNRELRSNLRVLLLNNGGGGIFEKFDGLRQSPARERFVMAQHGASAEGVCQSFGVRYQAAHNMAELESGLMWLTTPSVGGCSGEDGPLLLEVFTDSANDSRVLQDYYRQFGVVFQKIVNP